MLISTELQVRPGYHQVLPVSSSADLRLRAGAEDWICWKRYGRARNCKMDRKPVDGNQDVSHKLPPDAKEVWRVHFSGKTGQLLLHPSGQPLKNQSSATADTTSTTHTWRLGCHGPLLSFSHILTLIKEIFSEFSGHGPLRLACGRAHWHTQSCGNFFLKPLSFIRLVCHRENWNLGE